MKRISQKERSLIHSSCQLADKNYSKFKRRAAIKTEAAPKQHPKYILAFMRPCRQVSFAVLFLPPLLLTNFLRTHSEAPGLFDMKRWFRICSKIRHPSA
jgi:hypothetical protein